MKTESIYDCGTGASVEMVPAEVAQGLYDALEQAVTSMQDIGYPNSNVAVQAAREALAAADGEGES